MTCHNLMYLIIQQKGEEIGIRYVFCTWRHSFLTKDKDDFFKNLDHTAKASLQIGDWNKSDGL